MPLRAKLARGIADAVRRAPRALSEPLAFGVGALLMLGYGRRAALESLACAFPEWNRRRRWLVAAAAYHQMGRALVEFLHTRDYTEEEIRDRVEIENMDALEAARAAGRGVILLSGHYGNWEWVGRFLTAEGYPLAALHKEPKDAGLAERLRAVREAAGVVQIDYEDMRAAAHWLRKGGVLAIIMDQEPRRSRDGAVAPLFGRPTMTHVGPFRLARLAGAPVMTIFSRRVGPGRYRGRLEPLALSDAADPESAAAEDAAAFNARLEAAIRRAPDHWVWMYQRWKRLERRERAADPARTP